MHSFEYAAPFTLQEAFTLLSPTWGETDILAGGTDLLSLMKQGIHQPRRVVSLKNVKDLSRIDRSNGGLLIGAKVTLHQLFDNIPVRTEYPALHRAAGGVHSLQMRAMGTVGGDLLQRPRCWYFRNGFGLLGRDAKGTPLVPAGENRYHAILGNAGPAYFVNASSLAPALVALDARIRIASARGEREIDAGQLYRIPAAASEREVTLAPNEILTHIVLPASAGTRSATYEVRKKQGLDWPLTTASVCLRMKAETVESARIALGHVAPTPWRSSEAEAVLKNNAITEKLAASSGHAALAKATPLSGNAYKVQLTEVAIKRAILAAAGVTPI